MKFNQLLSSICFLLLLVSPSVRADPKPGYFLPDSVNEMILRYRKVKNLIVLPVIINDSVRVNLILDTGCRNLILFGKKFKKLFHINSNKQIPFSGLGNGKQVVGLLSLGNKVVIDHIIGTGMPVVVVENKNLFASYANIHGVIGYEIFLQFEIELNAHAGTITFRPALKTPVPFGYAQIPLRIVDSRPVMNSRIFVNNGMNRMYDLMIDTGSSLGLLLKTTDMSEFNYESKENILGTGLNGPVFGITTVSDRLMLGTFEMKSVPTGIVSSEWHNNGSIGMEILKDYIVIINYCKSYAYFRPAGYKPAND